MYNGFAAVAEYDNPIETKKQVVNNRFPPMLCKFVCMGIFTLLTLSFVHYVVRPPSVSPLPWTVLTGAKNAFI